MTGKPPADHGEKSEAGKTTSTFQISPRAIKFAPLLKIKIALKTRTVRKNKIISFKEAKRIMSWYQVSKKECFELLEELQQEGFLKISGYHGVIIKER